MTTGHAHLTLAVTSCEDEAGEAVSSTMKVARSSERSMAAAHVRSKCYARRTVSAAMGLGLSFAAGLLREADAQSDRAYCTQLNPQVRVSGATHVTTAEYERVRPFTLSAFGASMFRNATLIVSEHRTVGFDQQDHDRAYGCDRRWRLQVSSGSPL